MTRSALLFSLAALVVLSAAAAALGKERVEATLKTRIPLSATPGEQLTVAWKLVAVDEDGKRRPFGAGGVFIKLLSASGGRATVAFAEGDRGETGTFRARPVVPEGGIGGILIGLRGIASGPTGSTTSDVYFSVKNPPPASATAPMEARGEPTSARASESPSNGSVATWIAVLALISPLALAALGIVEWQRRRRSKGVSLPGIGA